MTQVSDVTTDDVGTAAPSSEPDGTETLADASTPEDESTTTDAAETAGEDTEAVLTPSLADAIAEAARAKPIVGLSPEVRAAADKAAADVKATPKRRAPKPRPTSSSSSTATTTQPVTKERSAQAAANLAAAKARAMLAGVTGTGSTETVEKDADEASVVERPIVTPSIARIDDPTADAIRRSAVIAGPMTDDPGTKIRFRRMNSPVRTVFTWLIALVTLSLSVAYAVWLVRSGPPLDDRILRAASVAVAVLIVTTLTIEVLRLALITMLSMSTSLVRSPVPVRPHKNLKTAVFITFVPSSESLTMLAETLTAAKHLQVPHGTEAGPDDAPALIDIYVLDEGDPTDSMTVQELVDWIDEQGTGNAIRRISRRGIAKYNEGRTFETKTKHGNVNAAYDVISHDPELPDYDVIVGLDPDHVPMPELITRLVGYFNDPNVAYVAAPQAYANSTVSVVPKLAESQQFVFHSLIQTAANSYGGPMLVGTNYAIRTSVFNQIGGAQPSITEDLATGLKALSQTNPDTGKKWTAVYTPDVLAHGEGPNTWGAYFKQQNRWATGAIRHVIAGPFVLEMFRQLHAPRRVLHHSLLMAFYPVMAITWILGAVNAGMFAIFGASGTIVSPDHWVLFYTWAIVAQVTLFIWARKNNVSPYESANSWGVYGMFMSVAAAPIYVAALLKSLVTGRPTFDVTPKGGHSSQGDSLFTFRLNLFWAALYVAIIVTIVAKGWAAISTLAWPVLALALACAPILIWAFSTRRRRRAAKVAPTPTRLQNRPDSNGEEPA